MKLTEIESFNATSRWAIRPGSLVRFGGGGPEFIGSDGEKHRMTLPGTYRVKSIHRAGRTRHRYFLEVSGVDRVSGTYTAFVAGPPYRSKTGLMIRPYRLKRPKRTKRHGANA